MSRDYWWAIEPYWTQLSSFDTPEVYLAGCRGIPQWVVFLHAAHWVRSEVCNGGFHQFFFNSTGILAPEAVLGLKDMGLLQMASTIGKAMKMLGAPYPRERDERISHLGKLPKSAFESLEDVFFGLLDTEHDGFQKTANRYAEVNA